MILGTGGGLRHARDLLDDGSEEPIVVVNGKIMLDLNLAEVLAAHRALGAEATMVLRPDPEAAKWGSFRLGADGRIARFLDASPTGSPIEPVATGDPLMFTGVHVLQPSFLDRIPPQGEQCVIRTAYRSLFHEGRRLFGTVLSGYWWEHSTVDRYLQGVWNVLEGRAELAHAPGPVRGVHPDARVHPDAEVRGPVFVDAGAVVEAGASVGPLVQVGAGAVIRAGVTIERSVVWDGARVATSGSDAVIA
jgi:mannose-1-phosphate guanylyltransferase